MMKKKYKNNNVVTMQLKNGVHNLSLTSTTFPVPKNNFRNGLNPKGTTPFTSLPEDCIVGECFDK